LGEIHHLDPTTNLDSRHDRQLLVFLYSFVSFFISASFTATFAANDC